VGFPLAQGKEKQMGAGVCCWWSLLFCFVLFCLFVCLVVWLVGWLVVVVVASGGVVVFVLVVFSQSIRSNSDQTHPSFGQ
jgi:Flp pilus assembly protein TadB